MMVTIEKCPCGHRGCSDYHLVGLGKFVQGSGFTKQEAGLVAKLVNSFGAYPNFEDVQDFHQKFELMNSRTPRQLTKRKLKERVEFLMEELVEFCQGCGLDMVVQVDSDGTSQIVDEVQVETLGIVENFTEQADALIDLVYVAMGTAVMMGLPWQQLWDDVHRANMSKVRGVSHRGHAVDCIKPEGWVGPKTMEILVEHGFDATDTKRWDDYIVEEDS